MNKTIKLTTITPLHIGAGDELTPLEFACLNDDTYYVVNQTRLFKALKENGYLETFLSEVDKLQKEFNLTEFLKKEGLLNKDFLNDKVVGGYSLTNPQKLIPKGIRPFIRNANSQPYIPGTAIKGAIRTAILFCLLKEVKDKMSESNYKNFLHPLVNFSKGRKKVAEKLDNEFLKNYCLPEAKRFSAHTDIFRALKVSDSKPLESSLVLQEIKMIRLNAEKKEGWEFTGDISIYAECIPEKTTLEFELKVDEDILEEFKVNNKEKKIPFANSFDMLKMCKDFSEQIIASDEIPFFEGLEEVDSMKVFYTNKDLNLRLGWGSGITETTVFSLLSEELKGRIVKEYFPKSRYPDFPKTRRVTVINKRPHQPLGWVRLEVKR